MKPSALIVIDYQNDFISPEGKVAGTGKFDLTASQSIQPKLQKLIDHWHSKNQPVFFVISDYNLNNYESTFKELRQKSPYGDSAKTGTWGHELYELKASESDTFVVKHYFDGFLKTDLEEQLRSRGIEDLTICGINTDVCVFHTTMSAVVRSFRISLVEDATAASRTENHPVFMNYMEKIGGARRVTTDELINQ